MFEFALSSLDLVVTAGPAAGAAEAPGVALGPTPGESLKDLNSI